MYHLHGHLYSLYVYEPDQHQALIVLQIRTTRTMQCPTDLHLLEERQAVIQDQDS
jgi:hypothetical protein